MSVILTMVAVIYVVSGLWLVGALGLTILWAFCVMSNEIKREDAVMILAGNIIWPVMLACAVFGWFKNKQTGDSDD